MSCNGCRVLRKGCSESCVLRPCLQWIDSADAQGHATVFVAKFFGRAGLMGFINAVPETQRRALFQSLLYEACGRTVNPVFGAVGLLWAGNWQVCQAAVETVLKGGSLKAPSPCSLTFSSLPQGPLHPTSNPGKDNTNIIISAAASRGRDSLMLPTITTVVKEDNNTRVATTTTTTEHANNPFQGIHGYESKDHAVMVKSSWDLKWDAPLQQGGTVKGNVVNANVVLWPETVGNKKVGEKREGTHPTQVLARRVKPSSSSCGGMGDREYGMYGGQGVTVFRKDGHRGLFEDQDTVVGSTEHLDLGLTLMVKDGGKGGQITGLKRVYSPSCDSVNSEGSVTSLDTTPRHGHGHGHGHHGYASFSSSSQVNFGAAGDMAGHMMNNNHKLLPLLL